MTRTDIILQAIQEEAELRRQRTDGDPYLQEITITVKLDKHATYEARAVEWFAKSHRIRKT